MAVLLDIRQTHVISEQNLVVGKGAKLISSVVTYRLRGNFHSHIYKLNYCIRHHHGIRRCVYESNTEQNECFFLPM